MSAVCVMTMRLVDDRLNVALSCMWNAMLSCMTMAKEFSWALVVCMTTWVFVHMYAMPYVRADSIKHE